MSFVLDLRVLQLKKWLHLGDAVFMDNSSAKPATGGAFQQLVQQTIFSFEALTCPPVSHLAKDCRDT